MGKITMHISAQNIPTASGKIGSILDTDVQCNSVWTVSAKTNTTAWISWAILGSGVSIVKTGGGGTINGEQLNNEIFEYTVTMDVYKSPQGNLNDFLSQITFTLKESEFGAVLDTKTFQRFHTDNVC